MHILYKEKNFRPQQETKRDILGHYGTLDTKETGPESQKRKENKRSTLRKIFSAAWKEKIVRSQLRWHDCSGMVSFSSGTFSAKHLWMVVRLKLEIGDAVGMSKEEGRRGTFDFGVEGEMGQDSYSEPL
jgi:hypothetical protein